MSESKQLATSPSTTLDLLRVALLRHSLHFLGRVARRLASSDLKRPHWRRGRCAGQDLLIDESVSWPAPLPGLHFGALFKASAAHVSRGATALEVGAGAGVWSLCCLERGARVSATDLPEVDLSGLAEAALRRGGSIETAHGDLLSPYRGRRFDHIFFNPPFHVGIPQSPSERAYLGGAMGEVTRRYLTSVSEYLAAEGVAWVILPQHERELYSDELSRLTVTQVASRWLPLLGDVALLALQPSSTLRGDQASQRSVGPPLHQLPMNAVSECFLQLSHLMNTHSCEVVTLRGEVDAEAIRHAIGLVSRRHIITRATLSADQRFAQRGQVWVTQHPTPPPRYLIEDLDADELEDLSSSLDQEGRWLGGLPRVILDRVWDRSALNPAEGVPVEWRLLRAGERSYLLLISPHLCTDAFAGALLMSEVLQTYHDLSQALSDDSPNDESLRALSAPHGGSAQAHDYQCRDPLASYTRWLPRSIRELKRTGAAIGGIISDLVRSGSGIPRTLTRPQRPEESASSMPHRGRTGMLIHRVTADELQEVLQGARSHGVKAHSLFTWGLLKAMKEWSSERGLKVGRALRFVDLCALRPLLSKERASDFDVLVQPYTQTLSTHWSRERVIKRLGHHLERQKREGVIIDLKRSAIYARTARWLPRSLITRFTFGALLKTNLTTTNPGPALMQIERAGEAEVVDFINFPQIAPPAELGVIYTSYRGELRIVTLYDEECWREEDLKDLVDALWTEVLTSARASSLH